MTLPAWINGPILALAYDCGCSVNSDKATTDRAIVKGLDRVGRLVVLASVGHPIEPDPLAQRVAVLLAEDDGLGQQVIDLLMTGIDAEFVMTGHSKNVTIPTKEHHGQAPTKPKPSA